MPRARLQLPFVHQSGDVAIINATVAVREHIVARVDAWKFDDIHLGYGAAGLLRGITLLDEAMYLAAAPPSIGANILVRAAFECWLVGTWAVFGKEDGYLGIELYRIDQELKLVRANNRPKEDIDYLEYQKKVFEGECDKRLGQDVRPKPMNNFADIAVRLKPYIEQELGEIAEVLAAYDILYRTHSTYDAHPAKQLSQMIREGGDHVHVGPIAPWKNPVEAVGMVALYLTILGGWIDRAIGVSGDVWGALSDDLLAAITER